MSFKDLQLSKTEVVQGVCPTCKERTMLISLTKEIYRCITCGGDLRQYINGKYHIFQLRICKKIQR